ncbi:Amino acid/polyamine transporter I [Ascosphaera apis ARSEF 7405]|uniref:Amino acid/polyamine transporter I n=1 Tax=Ascosphaera apis ARSEF 7405 TaxID=392613 RepID=A0A167V107_9EURO|nr:Amino acid/polyamine transporter I [Ascosphaera apis ARSEF 7405]
MGFFKRSSLEVGQVETGFSSSISPKQPSPHGSSLDNRQDLEKRDSLSDGDNGRPSSYNTDGRLLSDKDHTTRSLKTRHIQLIGTAEMVTYLPISSPFIRFAGRYFDEALCVATGWNFFVFQAFQIPFEATACNMILNFWTDRAPVGAIVAIVLVLYLLLNVFAVKFYGETEFWLSLGKMLLIVGMICYTFVTMVGGNPEHDRFGFRYWRDPGSFAEYYKTGDLGRWLGFLQCLIQASFSISGPDYVSMAAGEAENPRSILPRAYNSVFVRLTAFFVFGSLAVGINVPYNDPSMKAAFDSGAPGATASPYVVAMTRLRIKVLPDIVNAMILTACFSAGNSYVYCASRSLFGLALEGKAPHFFTKCTKSGVPIYCVLASLAIGLLAFLQVSESAAVVLQWFVNLITASQLINFAVMAFIYTRFKKACEAQGIDRNTLPYKGRFQPFLAWYAFTGCVVMAFVGGYQVFCPGKWDTPTFFFSYTMIGVFPILYFGWKIIKGTKILKPEEIDITTGVAEIDEYSRNYVPKPPANFLERLLDILFG